MPNNKTHRVQVKAPLSRNGRPLDLDGITAKRPRMTAQYDRDAFYGVPAVRIEERRKKLSRSNAFHKRTVERNKARRAAMPETAENAAYWAAVAKLLAMNVPLETAKRIVIQFKSASERLVSELGHEQVLAEIETYWTRT